MLAPVVQTLQEAAPHAAGTLYYVAVSAFLKGDARAALDSQRSRSDSLIAHPRAVLSFCRRIAANAFRCLPGTFS